ncbi:hypothetical protein OG589_14465 [Sphaerisporangium sp. NBC_01403]|uniref:putative phage holin n=1 Tax=Sphaerisporangium sp. NBC_01403 TaxID=2903599 RepID=UPI00324B2C39
MIHQAGSALIVLSAVELLVCAVFYGGWFRWWTSPEGRHLFAFMAVFGTVLGLWTALLLSSGMAWDAQPAGGREWARLVGFAAVAVVLADRLRLLVKGKRDELRQRKAKGVRYGD